MSSGEYVNLNSKDPVSNKIAVVATLDERTRKHCSKLETGRNHYRLEI